MPTVAVVIIGDEILSGKFADENGPHLIRRLRELGADLGRLVTIGDSVAGIAREVAFCAAEHDLVVTTGGVGPTHDDMTLDGIGAAFGLEMEQHPRLVALLESYGMDLNPAALRMATIPSGSELIGGSGTSYPVLRVRNVYVFPGVPRLMRKKFEAVSDLFAGERVHTTRLKTLLRETEIAGALSDAQQASPDVAIGSYPRFDDEPWHVIITLESRDPNALQTAEARIRQTVPISDELGTEAVVDGS